ncbi:putative protein N(5)-glutamine methyltransferase [Rhodococcoides corynebacterioides]|uniref:putative protein N(5)-glutamine methyltransferase n=1 Tax=Rhodococcoides corynebacterioides TaxID=53972 RepID=UPI0027E1CDD3|nr:putative protein N(5)-glutamine methyltransferase [Rhodococcus corynebacterioides]
MTAPDDDPAAPLRPAELTAQLRRAGCVYAEDEARLLRTEAPDDDVLRDWVRRRVAGEPLETIVGWAEFHGHRVVVEPGVFVPRRRTEALVDVARGLVGPGAVVVDLCCGSGAIGLALTDVATVHAADVDPVAVACARRNLPPDRVFEGDLFDPLPAELRGRVDVVCANTPYVPSAAVASMPREARDSEPRGTLDGGPDGLDVQRRVAVEVVRWLTPTGSLLVETSAAQADAAAAIMRASGLRSRIHHDDERDATVVIGSAQG